MRITASGNPAVRPNKVTRNLTVAGSLALAGAAVSVFGAFGGELSPYVDLAGQFAVQAGVGAAGLALLFLLLRRIVLATASLAVGALACIAVAPQPAISPCVDQATRRVLFLNIWASNPNVENSIDFLARSEADTILVAEISPQFVPSLRRLRETYPYAIECPPNRRTCDFAAYSRVPISTWNAANESGMIGLDVSYPDGGLNLIGVHFARPWPFNSANTQINETNRVARAIAGVQGPRLVMGDFNAVTWGEVTRRMTKLATVFPLPSYGTWHTSFPWPLRVPIDQTLVGPGIACAAKSVGPRISSDHRPVWIDFALAKKTAPGR